MVEIYDEGCDHEELLTLDKYPLEDLCDHASYILA
jgi:hypothetical protein